MNVNHQSQTTRTPIKNKPTGSPFRRSPANNKYISSSTTSSSAPSSSRSLLRTLLTFGVGIGLGAVTAFTLSYIIQNENEFRYLSAVNYDERLAELQTLSTPISSLPRPLANNVADKANDIVRTISEVSPTQTINTTNNNNNKPDPAKVTTPTSVVDNNEQIKQPILESEVPKVVSSTQAISTPKQILPTAAKTKKIYKEFEHVDGGVIVTKIHGPQHLGPLEQSLCLLHYAYNERVKYDVIVFTAMNITEEELQPIRDVIAPARLTLVMDNPGLREMANQLSPERRALLLKQCNISKVEDLYWGTYITEFASEGVKETRNPVQYTWQAEFRSLHIWTHPILKPYRYMLWMDTDGFCTRKWDRDPMAVVANNDLVIAFDNFPMGHSKGTAFHERYQKAFNTSVCAVYLKDGHLEAKTGKCNRPDPNVAQIHGFFHITDLDFYRSEPVMNWNRILIGDTKFSRNYDDQIAVTVPAAVLAPEKAWHMPSKNLTMKVFHNFVMDGVGKNRVGGFKHWWKMNGTQSFPEAYGKCRVVNAGR